MIGFASRLLSDVERRYSQTEKEALALVTRIVEDASPVGLGEVLTQLHGSEWRVIGFASRLLSDEIPATDEIHLDRRYSQTEKEALALDKRIAFSKKG